MTILRTALLGFLLSLAPGALAFDVPLPPPPSGTALQPAATTPPGSYSVGLSAGFLSQGGVASAMLQVDVGRRLDLEALKRVRLEVHLPVRVARPEWTGTITETVIDPFLGPITSDVGTSEDRIWIFEAIPTARLVVPAVQRLALHAEVGVGLAVTSERHVEDVAFIGRTTDTSLVLAPTIHFALGLTWQLGERLDLVFQPVALGRRAKADAGTFSALWGLSYRL